MVGPPPVGDLGPVVSDEWRLCVSVGFSSGLLSFDVWSVFAVGGWTGLLSAVGRLCLGWVLRAEGSGCPVAFMMVVVASGAD